MLFQNNDFVNKQANILKSLSVLQPVRQGHRPLQKPSAYQTMLALDEANHRTVLWTEPVDGAQE